MPKKYINANQIQWHSNWLISGDKRVFAYQDEVDNIPAADVEEVRHGYWIFGTTMHHEWMKCSECLVSQTPTGVFSYCPNCGAKMDGKENTDGDNDGISKNN